MFLISAILMLGNFLVEFIVNERKIQMFATNFSKLSGCFKKLAS